MGAPVTHDAYFLNASEPVAKGVAGDASAAVF
jgi:hypothetical protein